jgi:hypothetical protein
VTTKLVTTPPEEGALAVLAVLASKRFKRGVDPPESGAEDRLLLAPLEEEDDASEADIDDCLRGLTALQPTSGVAGNGAISSGTAAADIAAADIGATQVQSAKVCQANQSDMHPEALSSNQLQWTSHVARRARAKILPGNQN